MTHAATSAALLAVRDDRQSGLDLEAFRVREGLTYDQLAAGIGVPHASQARRYAMGERWPDPDVMDRVVAYSDGAVSVLAMHIRRTKWVRENKPVKRVPVSLIGPGTP
jgi:hypothetical protein